MNLTTMKVSVPVLMLMMFQSGFCVEDWFEKAALAAKEGNGAQFYAIVQEAAPDQLEKLSAEKKTEFRKTWMESVRSEIDKVAPRSLRDVDANTHPRTDAVGSIAADGTPSGYLATVIAAFDAGTATTSSEISNDCLLFVLSRGGASFWPVHDAAAGLADIIATTCVPPQADIEGTDQDDETSGTLWGILKNASDPAKKTEALDSLLARPGLSGVTTKATEFDADTIKADIDAITGTDAAANAAKLAAVYNAVVTRATAVRTDAYQAATITIGDTDNDTITAAEKTAIEAAVLAETDQTNRAKTFEDTLLNTLEAKQLDDNNRSTVVNGFLSVYLHRMNSGNQDALVTAIVDDVKNNNTPLKEACASTVGDVIESMLRNDTKYSGNYESFIKGLDEKLADLNTAGIDITANNLTPEQKEDVMNALKDYVQTFDAATASSIVSNLKAIKANQP
jgi:hypothetical protein